VNEDTPFPFQTIKEAWEYFNKSARMYFAKLIRALSKEDKTIRKKFKELPNRDYCARLLYILSMFVVEGIDDSEFDLDWAMLVSKPLSASQARKSLDNLIELGLIQELDIDEDNNEPTSGGDTSSDTKFDFD